MMDRVGRLGSAHGTRPSSVGYRPCQGGWGSPRTHPHATVWGVYTARALQCLVTPREV